MQKPLPPEYKHLVIRVMSGDFEITSLPARIDCPSPFRSRAKAESWLADHLEQINAAGVKVRHCLCCRKQFLSLGAHNRMCQPCRRMVDAEAVPASFSYRNKRAAHV